MWFFLWSSPSDTLLVSEATGWWCLGLLAFACLDLFCLAQALLISGWFGSCTGTTVWFGLMFFFTFMRVIKIPSSESDEASVLVASEEVCCARECCLVDVYFGIAPWVSCLFLCKSFCNCSSACFLIHKSSTICWFSVLVGWNSFWHRFLPLCGRNLLYCRASCLREILQSKKFPPCLSSISGSWGSGFTCFKYTCSLSLLCWPANSLNYLINIFISLFIPNTTPTLSCSRLIRALQTRLARLHLTTMLELTRCVHAS